MRYEDAAVQALREATEQFGAHILMNMNRYSTGESLVLYHLSFHDGLSNPSVLQEKAGTSSARIAAILRSLEKKGLIQRDVDLEDRRKTVVTVTQEGRQRALDEYEEMQEKLKKVFKKLGKKDTEDFIRILGRFFEAFGAIDASPCRSLVYEESGMISGEEPADECPLDILLTSASKRQRKKPAEKSAEMKADKPADKPAEIQAEKPTAKPEKPTEKPTAKPEETTNA